MKDPSELFDILFSELETQRDLCQGLGILCFEMIKGVKHQFHSMTDSALPILFSKLGCCQGKSNKMTQSLCWNLVRTVCKGVLVYHKYYLLSLKYCITDTFFTSNNKQLSAEGEVNRGGYIYSFSPYIFTAVYCHLPNLRGN